MKTTKRLKTLANTKNTKYNFKAVIVGCARDIQTMVLHSITQMYKLGSEFEKFVIVIYENDSEDDTLNILKEFSRLHTNVIILSGKKVKGHRTKVLAHARNTLLQYARRHYTNYDFFIVMDMDFMRCNTKSLASIACLMKPWWNAVTAVSRKEYYDWWAFRCKRLNMDYDCLNDNVEIEKKGNGDNWHDKWKHHMNDRLRKVESAFNGIAIYRFSSIPTTASYVGSEHGMEICEHVKFNECIPNIYIHPKLISSTWDH